MTNVREASLWLSYTYLFVRMLRNPLAYGVGWEELTADPRLEGRRYNTPFCLHLTVFDAAQRYQSHKAWLNVENLLLLSFVTAASGDSLLQHVRGKTNLAFMLQNLTTALLMPLVSCQVLPRPLYTAVPCSCKSFLSFHTLPAKLRLARLPIVMTVALHCHSPAVSCCCCCCCCC